jgi:hypothetical protein
MQLFGLFAVFIRMINMDFYTFIGDPVSTAGYNLWYSGYNPSNAGVNSAAVISKALGTMAYNTNPSATNFVFICEHD